MKKISVVFLAMVLATGMAMAQNSAVVSTTGSFNDATINQGLTNNTADILQVQNGNSGYHAKATINQVAGDNWGKINQYNTRNYATVAENKNDRGQIYQDGSVNSSKIAFEYGKGANVGYVEQIGTYNGGYIYTTFNNNGTVADPLSIVQHGNTNNAVIEAGWNAPASTYDLASIIQLGDNNISKIRQEGGDRNIARVSQTGNLDVANLTQTGGYLEAYITQYNGDKNVVNLTQTGGIAHITQGGDANLVEGLKTGLVQDPLATFAGNTLDVMQLGTNNTLDLKSASFGAVVNVYQNGASNWSQVNN